MIVLLVNADAGTGSGLRTMSPPTQNCVGCGGAPSGCLSCKGGGDSANCYTDGCEFCVSVGACGDGGGTGPLYNAAGSGQAILGLGRSFTLDRDLIGRVGAVHPRFAATLANVNRGVGFRAGTYNLHWMPVAMNPSDVDAYINRSQYDDFFAKRNREVRRAGQRIAAGEDSLIVYRMDVEEAAGGVTLTLTVLQGSHTDPQFTRLTINGISDPEKPNLLRASNWSIN